MCNWILFIVTLPVFAQNVWAQDMEGIHLGMPFKEAMAALKAHSGNLKLVPDGIRYPGTPDALTYGLNAVGPGEGFYFLLAMPPNPVTVLKITRVVHYGEGTMPLQDVVVANLAAKYGPVSYDTTSAALSVGSRDIFWIDDLQGNRVRGKPVPRCLGQSTFYMNGLLPGSRNQFDPVNVRLPGAAAKLRIEEGFVNRGDPLADVCAPQTMVHARLFQARVLGVRVPNLVEYVVLMMASGPLDQKATKATHDLWRASVRPNKGK